MKGVLLAGGKGTRLHPLTLVTSKQLLPVFDKPMIYYALSTLIHSSVSEVLIIANPDDIPKFSKLLGDGRQFGVKISYKAQSEPLGIAHALIGIEHFLQGEDFWFILGDNFFHGPTFGSNLRSLTRSGEALCFLYRVANPKDFGVAVINDSEKITKIVEKPEELISNLAIPGLYFLPCDAPAAASKLPISSRGEIEITDLLRVYLGQNRLTGIRVSRGNTWLDLGNAAAIAKASTMVQVVQDHQGLLIGSPEEAAFHAGFITKETALENLAEQSDTAYVRQLREVLSGY